MANYSIIGGDNKEYGPVSDADVRLWIAEGRLNATSRAKGEGDAEFRALAQFPEFAIALSANPVIPPIQPVSGGTGDHATALQRIKAPALGLIIISIINLLLSAWSLIQWLFFPPNPQKMAELETQLQQLNNPQLTDFIQKIMHISTGPFGLMTTLLGAAMSVLILLGAIKMMSLRSYEFAFTAAVISVIPCLTPCCGYVIGLAFGIWALVLLKKPEIKSQFS